MWIQSILRELSHDLSLNQISFVCCLIWCFEMGSLDAVQAGFKLWQSPDSSPCMLRLEPCATKPGLLSAV